MSTGRRLILGLALAAFAIMAGPKALYAAESAGTLRVGTYLDNKPWQFREAGGTIVGFEVDMVDYIAGHLGKKVELQQLPFRELFAALADHRIDLVMSSISVTEERKAHFDFTQPYFDTSQGVVVLTRSGIRGLADLAGKTVSVIPGTTNEIWVEVNKSRYGFAKVIQAQGLDGAIAGLVAGRADAHFGDLPALLYLLLKRSDLAVVARLPTSDSYALMLAKNSPLTAKVDALVAEMKRDGTLARIHEKWFGIVPEPSSSTIKVLPRP